MSVEGIESESIFSETYRADAFQASGPWNNKTVTIESTSHSDLSSLIVPYGGRCHGEYSFDVDVDKEGVDVGAEVKVENEDEDTALSVDISVHVQPDGSTEVSGHAGFTTKF